MLQHAPEVVLETDAQISLDVLTRTFWPRAVGLEPSWFAHLQAGAAPNEASVVPGEPAVKWLSLSVSSFQNA